MTSKNSLTQEKCLKARIYSQRFINILKIKDLNIKDGLPDNSASGCVTSLGIFHMVLFYWNQCNGNSHICLSEAFVTDTLNVSCGCTCMSILMH
jgi:hypothetical protein